MSIAHKKERLLLLFLGILTLVNLIQGGTTQLIYDEAITGIFLRISLGDISIIRRWLHFLQP